MENGGDNDKIDGLIIQLAIIPLAFISLRKTRQQMFERMFSRAERFGTENDRSPTIMHAHRFPENCSARLVRWMDI